MTAYALSPTRQQVAYLLYTRDMSETQEDKRGKLYNDLMIQKTQVRLREHLERRVCFETHLAPRWDSHCAHRLNSNLVLSDLNVKRSGRFIQDPHQNPVVSQTSFRRSAGIRAASACVLDGLADP